MIIEDYIQKIKDKNIHIVGVFGVEGAEIALFLNKWGCKNLTFHDFAQPTEARSRFLDAHFALSVDERNHRYQQLLNIPAKFNYCNDYLKEIEKADLIFVPQSWDLYEFNNPLKYHREKLRNLMQLYFKFLPNIIAVTGSNGKTTTTFLIKEILQKKYADNLYLAGNDRRSSQLLLNIEKISRLSWVVLEISNRHLKFDLGRSPDIGIITNITQNHLSEHLCFEDYVEVKKSIFKYKRSDQIAVLNYDDKITRSCFDFSQDNFWQVSLKEKITKGVYLKDEIFVFRHHTEETKIMPIKEVQLPGLHNLYNVAQAILVGMIIGVDPSKIREVVKSFQSLPQRMELVGSVNGIRFYNDTASTTPESTIAALESIIKKNVILILGGKNKNLELNALVDTILEKVKFIILLESPLSNEIAILLKAKGFEGDRIFHFAYLKQAVEKSKQLAKSGDLVLFSPAGEYFSYFKDKMPGYKNFRKFVSKLVK